MKRLVALDVFRGFTVAGMIWVNVPGSWSHVYAPLLHAEWDGLTLADLVFPFFIFILGVSIMLALSRMKEKGVEKTGIRNKIIKRSLIIFVIGIMLNLISYKFQELRIPGVLQRIAIVYFVVATMFLYLRANRVYAIGIVLFVGYWLLMVFVPIPGELAASLAPAKNWSNYIDSLLIPFKQYGGTWDPEGILSTIPSIATALLGLKMGELVSKYQLSQKLINQMLIWGTVLVVLGAVWSVSFPPNKNLWSNSYVLLTGGLAYLILALFIYLIDLNEKVKWATVGLRFGVNALAAYILHYLLIIPLSWFRIGGYSIQEWFMYLFVDLGLPSKLVSCLWALLFVLICYLPISKMYEKKMFVKI